MVRVVFATALIAVSMIAFTPAAHATRSLDDVLARLEALEKENAGLRKRVQRLEAAERERPVMASVPASAPRGPLSQSHRQPVRPLPPFRPSCSRRTGPAFISARPAACGARTTNGRRTPSAA
jgi:hypothetical protein